MAKAETKSERPMKVNKTVRFGPDEAAEIEQHLRELAAERRAEVTFTDWANGLLLAAARRKRKA